MGGAGTYDNKDRVFEGKLTFEGETLFNGPVTGSIAKKQYGDEYFVDPTHGDDGLSGKTPGTAKATLPAAEELCTANQNDVVYYLNGSSSLSLAASLTWDKSYTHLIGVGAPARYAKRTRIFHSANFTPLITLSGSGCMFKNLYASYGRGNAGNLTLLTVTGGRNVLDGIHFAAMNHATEAGTAGCIGVHVNGTSAEENVFKNCVFGNNTIARSAANCMLKLDGSCPRNYFEDCDFIMMSSSADAVHVLVDATGIDRFAIFKRCMFHSHGTALTQAINSDISDTTNRQILMIDCWSLGATDIADATGDGTIWFNTQTATANVAMLMQNVAVS